MVNKVAARGVYRGSYYDIWEVAPVAGATGGGPQQDAPFAPGSPAAIAQEELGIPAFRADIGNGYVHLYTAADATPITGNPGRTLTEKPQTNPVGPVPDEVRPEDTTRIYVDESGNPAPNLEPPVNTLGVVQPNITPTNPLSIDLGGGTGTGPAPTGTIGLIETFGRSLLGLAIKPWAKMPANSPPQAVLAAAIPEESDISAVAGLLQGFPSSPGLYWVGRNSKGWFVPIRFGPDLQMSETIASLMIDTNRIAGDVAGPNVGAGGGTGSGPGVGPFVPMGDAIAELLGPGQEPLTIVTRRCRGPYRLATNGRCYHKRLLPSAFRANRARKAPVSWQDAQNIRKGEQAQERITKAAAKKGYVRKRTTRRRKTT